MAKSTQYFYLLENTIQNYPWGSKIAIAEQFDFINPELLPQAELWMGTHPNGCSKTHQQGESLTLKALIDSDKAAALNPQTAEQFGELPFLLKILAAETPLSIQVHPNKQQAETGFACENAQHIALTDKTRNYKDPNHKPELVYALTNYEAMNGFREYSEILNDFKQLALSSIAGLVNNFSNTQTSSGLEEFFVSLLNLPKDTLNNALNELLERLPNISNSCATAMVTRLSKYYPGDVGLFFPFLLNIVTLKPNQAMYLDAGTPHAYIRGTGLEIMANSDNVLRAGLTKKHIDTKELTKCVVFEPKPLINIVLEPRLLEHEECYPAPVDDFKFSIINTPTYQHIENTSAEILLAIDGGAMLYHGSGETLKLTKGNSVFVPACTKGYRLTANGRVARARN
ncbi:mannose-6-phosphate isomerase, class I [Agarivorans sp. Alg241-V36]|uniref:mannose-6-phosphate isomerase, class I n=1 Tax=Agarivorans sp. Alg241-V36 TaxID=2305992 RepID=UPI0013D37F34|nr:mannose-6-phosphate isomerase, class I [Agarivorans sp. Alg241-V36]